MADPRENPKVDEGFHEETPQEFAAEPDREFTKVPPQSSDAASEEEPEEQQQAGLRKDEAAGGDE